MSGAVQRLPFETFQTVVEHAPLVAIDFIVKDLATNTCLLGKRRFPPAKGMLFTPGGRIYKNERYECALRRLLREELGSGLEHAQVSFHGVYEHLYEESSVDGKLGTHYVVHVVRVDVDKLEGVDDAFRVQHDDAVWLGAGDIAGSDLVHSNCKDYFVRGSSTEIFRNVTS